MRQSAWLACGALFVVVGCASDPVPTRPDTFGKPNVPTVAPATATPPKPVVAKPTPPPPPPAPVEVPKAPSLADAVAGKEIISPLTILSPVLGSWVWANDPNFLMTFHPDGTLDYGFAQGKFQMLGETTVVLQLLVNQGKPIQAPQEQWSVQFFENRTVLLIVNQRQQAMVFKRPVSKP